MSVNRPMSARGILEQLNALDEAAQFEAKEGREVDKSVRETICAFCNEPDLGGGYLIFGVRKTQHLLDVQYQVQGVEDADKIQCDLATQCRGLFSVVVRPDIHVEEIDGKKIVWAYIPEAAAGDKPVTLKNNGRAFRRIGSSDHVCTQDDLDLLYHLRANRFYDETPIYDGDMRDFSPEAIDDYRRLRRRVNADAWELTASNEDLLRSLHCLVFENGLPRPTVAGIQLFGTQAALRRCFPMARIDYIRITGTRWVQDPENRFDAVELRDSIFAAIRRAEAAIFDDLPKAFRLPEGTWYREEIPLLPVIAIREAVVNAVMHRNYRANAGPIQIIRYSNRLEIRNPGHSLKPEEQLGKPGSDLRNPAIAAVLHETHLAETKGSGIMVMRDLMEQANLEPPTFKSSRSGDDFVVTFLFHHFLTEENLQWLNSLAEHDLSQEDQKALIYARETGFIDNAAYRGINQADTLTASVHLRRLRDLKLLVMDGKGAKTYYVLPPELLKPGKLPGKPDTEKTTTPKTTQKTIQKTDQKTTQKIIHLITQKPDITRQQMAQTLGLSDAGMKYHLRKMQEKNIIRRVGPDKGGHWEVVEK